MVVECAQKWLSLKSIPKPVAKPIALEYQPKLSNNRPAPRKPSFWYDKSSGRFIRFDQRPQPIEDTEWIQEPSMNLIEDNSSISSLDSPSMQLISEPDLYQERSIESKAPLNQDGEFLMNGYSDPRLNHAGESLLNGYSDAQMNHAGESLLNDSDEINDNQSRFNVHETTWTKQEPLDVESIQVRLLKYQQLEKVFEAKAQLLSELQGHVEDYLADKATPSDFDLLTVLDTIHQLDQDLAHYEDEKLLRQEHILDLKQTIRHHLALNHSVF